MDFIRRLAANYRYTAIALVTVLTLVIVGAVVLTTTSAGCGPANALKVKTTRCVGGSPVAKRGLVPSPAPTFVPRPVTLPSVEPPPPPTITPASGPGPSSPYNPAGSAYPPYDPNLPSNGPVKGPGSGGGPPLASPGSGGGPPGIMISCRLPVSAGGGPGSGGFIVLPDQTFVADPRSAVVAPLPSPAPSPPPQSGYGPNYPPGFYGLTYDGAFSKWVPVPFRWLSPDGAHYAYGLGGDIYVQSVAGGPALELGEGQGFTPLDVANDGVYVVKPNLAGLWFLPYSGTAKQLTATGFWQAVGGGAAYGTSTSAVPQGVGTTLQKLDLKAGTVNPYFSDDGGTARIVGFDYWGNPVIHVSYTSGQVLYIAGPQNYFVIASFAYQPYYYGQQQAPFPFGSPIADSHGLWFTVGNGVVLYSSGAWFWMSSIGGQPAGACA